MIVISNRLDSKWKLSYASQCRSKVTDCKNHQTWYFYNKSHLIRRCVFGNIVFVVEIVKVNMESLHLAISENWLWCSLLFRCKISIKESGFITTRQRSCGKVIFSVVSVCQSVCSQGVPWQLTMQMESSIAEILKFVMAYGTNQVLSVWKI